MKKDLSKLFISIRDIPYRIPLSPNEEDCACVGKNQKLKEELQKRGLEVRWRMCEFRWSDLPIPKSVIAVQHDDCAQHAYLEIKIEDAWKTVDVSWDSGLSDVFEIATWEGLNGTAVAVPCRGILSPEDSRIIMAFVDDNEAIQKDLNLNGNFYKALNEWLDYTRAATMPSK